MPDRTFENIVTDAGARPKSISMATGGWGDDIISNFDLYMQTFRYYGLLAAKIGATLSASGTLTFFTLTSQSLWVFVDRILIFRRGTTPSSNLVSFGSDSPTFANWQPDVALNGLTSDDAPLEVLPEQGGTVYSDTVARALGHPGVNNETGSPLLPSFGMADVGGSGISAELDYYVYGALIDKDV